jgi:hypothetical protein
MLSRLDLSGAWSFALDPHGVMQDTYWAAPAALSDTIELPGSIDEAEKTPLTTGRTMAYLSRKHPYVGKAWYRRTITITAEQAGLFHWLFLERPHGQIDLFVDGIKTGRDESLSTPNRFFIGKLAEGEHTLTLLIDNAQFEAVGDAHLPGNPDVAHSKSDHTQTNWNGVVGRIELQSQHAGIAKLAVFAPTRSVRVEFDLEAYEAETFWPTTWKGEHENIVRLTFQLAGADAVIVERKLDITSSLTHISIEAALPGETRLWDEFDPVIHHVEVEWLRDGKLLDRTGTDFGIRSITTKGRHILLNGRRIFLRGTLDCSIFPLTGYPPTDKAGWHKAFGTAKAYGLNHIRFHSYCPPKAAFEVADELGLILHVETPIWTILGADPALDRYIRVEAERIVEEYGNHPSFLMFTVGNEVYGGRMHAFLERFVEDWKARDDRRIYNGGSGWPTTERAQYVSKPEPRSHRWGEGMNSRLNARPLETRTDWSEWVQKVPMALVSHEIGQWCVYPDLKEIGKYTGVLEARNFEMVRDDLEAKGMLEQADSFMRNSGALQTMLYKEDIEAALRTPDFAGFQLLGLQDFSGQGTALVGVVDAFWDEKPYVTPQTFHEFCAPTVPLLRADGFVMRRGDTFTADLQIAHFGAATLPAGTLTVSVVGGDGRICGQWPVQIGALATGALHDVGQITVPTADLPDGLFELRLAGDGFANRYELAVLAAGPEAPLDIVRVLDAETLAQVEAGRTLVFAPTPDSMRPNAELGHTVLFWNTLWTKNQPPHTLGLINDLDHPLFAGFPALRHSSWHEWELTYGGRALDVGGLPVRHLIRVIDDWNRNRDLALVAEVQVGKGRLLLCAVDIENRLAERLVGAKLRSALAAYATGTAAAAPTVTAGDVLAWWERVRA